MVRKWGLEKMGMLTLGFEDPPPKTIKEASRRFNSLATNAKFSQRYQAWIAVVERAPKTGRIHFNLVVVIPFALTDAWAHFDALEAAYEGSKESVLD